ncbi:hypothetical protein KA050_02535 [Candidatus Gracilibacteria bacterium]|nr:hypothetical protein [Candidatus Gracilibacteria bacterium]
MNKIEDLIKQKISENIGKIKSNEPKELLKIDVKTPSLFKERYIAQINDSLEQAEKYKNSLLPYVRTLKQNISDITEQTHLCAIYLLLSHIFDSYDALFLLIRNGFSSALMNHIRMMKEADGLISLFVMEYEKSEEKNLKDWFSGVIVLNGKYRERIGDHYESFLGEEGASQLKEHEVFLHRLLSIGTHNGYATMIESITPFYEDFDLEKVVHYNYSLRTSSLLKGLLLESNLTLRNVYMHLLPGLEETQKLEKIQKEHNK